MPLASLVKIANGAYAWIGANGDSNAGAVETKDGLLVIDAQQTKTLGRTFRTAIEKDSGKSAVGLIDTHIHLDHTAGNVAFSDVPIFAQDATLESMIAYLGPANGNRWLVSDLAMRLKLFFGSNVQELLPAGDPLESWLHARLSGPEYQAIDLVGPSETFSDQIVFECQYDTLHAEYRGPAHCDGDLILYLPRQKIAFLGDLLFVGRFPWLGDCDLTGWINRLDYILSLEIDIVVPGHGGLSTLREVAAFQELLSTLRAGAAMAISSGLSEEATVRDIKFPQYANMPRYREWLPANLRAAYRYLKRA
jgi:glyoxylase-like metal-dependent hydrolase (beta-lactamase superfamily II)